MKKLFAICSLLFTLCGVAGAVADDSVDTARAAKRSAAGNIASSTVAARQKSDVSGVAATSGASRSSGTNLQKDISAPVARATTPRDGVVVTDNSRSATTATVAPRSGNVQSRAAVVAPAKISERASIGMPRTTIPTPGTVSRTSVQPGVARSAVQPSARIATMPHTARSATVTAAAVLNKDYKTCREVYYKCMDEFCANKDTQLKRCACSAKIHDFDVTKKQLTRVEDKMLEFNERLLTVNLEKEDAQAISIATEGEKAYQQDDKTKSKQILDEIAKKLKSSIADSELTKNMSAISLSLDADSAFDSIDSMLGASTTTKEGTALYSAALPICREMAAEVCDTDAAAIAESGYQMAIEQDCNTVSKTYETLNTQALEKIREGGALLDMARLDIYQKRNSDDILTCKKKMLDMMTDTSVCGTDLSKCLDTTGRYIDPSTGEAFLTVGLANLDKLINRPTGNEKWTSVAGNEKFVTFLESKKKYLEPAMENCQDIADGVWKAFIEDALAQIKLAQGRKLEDVRQSCTTLTAQCLTTTAKSVAEFDARALSIFGVSADKTVNEMCANVKTACTALLQTTGGDQDWSGGMTEIQTDKTYDTIIATCREVGKACIIQTCKSVSGNFGLCENIEKSTNRKSIINRTSCWNEVVNCVASAGGTSISRIMSQKGKSANASGGGNFWLENYGFNTPVRTNESAGCDPETQSCLFDICDDCGTTGKPDCSVCRLAEKIWGNCEFVPQTELKDENSQNRIIISKMGRETLLSWFAENTGTTTDLASCKDTSCGIGLTSQSTPEGGQKCIRTDMLCSDGAECPTPDIKLYVTQSPEFTNQMPNGAPKDDWGNICMNGAASVSGISSGTSNGYFEPVTNTMNMCVPTGGSGNEFGAAFMGTAGGYYSDGANFVVCVGGTITGDGINDTAGWPSGQTMKCSGQYVILNESQGTYQSPEYTTKADGTTPADPADNDPTRPSNYYSQETNLPQLSCKFNFKDNTWGTRNTSTDAWDGVNSKCNGVPGIPQNSNNNLFIKYY